MFTHSLFFIAMTDTEKRYLTKIDEINRLFYKPTENYKTADSLLQAVHDFLSDMYLEGYAATGYLLKDKERQANFEIIEELLLLNIDGKTLYDRISEYYAFPIYEDIPSDENGKNEPSESKKQPSAGKKKKIPDGNTGITPDEAIARVIETEAHRMYNSGGRNRAVEAGAKYKKWVTMGDEKVRTSHSYIDGVNIPIDDKFYTYDGDSALMPGGFEDAANNVNCRCWLNYGY